MYTHARTLTTHTRTRTRTQRKKDTDYGRAQDHLRIKIRTVAEHPRVKSPNHTLRDRFGMDEVERSQARTLGSEREKGSHFTATSPYSPSHAPLLEGTDR